MTEGPGWMPWMVMAPIIMAMTGLDGMPSVSMKMNDVCAPALFADSGPAAPSMAPRPNWLACLETFLSSAYEANEQDDSVRHRTLLLAEASR